MKTRSSLIRSILVTTLPSEGCKQSITAEKALLLLKDSAASDAALTRHSLSDTMRVC
jgi:hypothetical protein